MTTSRATASAPTASGGEGAKQADLDADADAGAAAEGVPAWFEAFFRAHYRDLLATGMAISRGDREIAEDAIMKVVERQIEGRRWNHIRDRLAFFKVAVIHQVYGEYRRINRSQKYETNNLGEMADTSDLRAQHQLNLWEDLEWVEGLLRELPSQQRQTMKALYEVLDPAELADILGGNPVTIRSNLRHARASLRTKVAPQSHKRMNQTSFGAGKETTK